MKNITHEERGKRERRISNRENAHTHTIPHQGNNSHSDVLIAKFLVTVALKCC